MLYLTDCYDSKSSLELTVSASKVLERLELPTPNEFKVTGRAAILAYCEKASAIHARHIKQAWVDFQRSGLDDLEENTENHNAIVKI